MALKDPVKRAGCFSSRAPLSSLRPSPALASRLSWSLRHRKRDWAESFGTKTKRVSLQAGNSIFQTAPALSQPSHETEFHKRNSKLRSRALSTHEQRPFCLPLLLRACLVWLIQRDPCLSRARPPRIGSRRQCEGGREFMLRRGVQLLEVYNSIPVPEKAQLKGCRRWVV